MSDSRTQDAEGEPLGTTYTIGELAREFDLTTRTIRYYELAGLRSPVRLGTQRLYRRRDRTRLKLILRSKRLGFTLAEMRELDQSYAHCLQLLEQQENEENSALPAAEG